MFLFNPYPRAQPASPTDVGIIKTGVLLARTQGGTRYANAQITEIAIPQLKEFTKENGKISVPQLKALLELDHQIIVGNNRTYDIVAVIERRLSM